VEKLTIMVLTLVFLLSSCAFGNEKILVSRDGVNAEE